MASFFYKDTLSESKRSSAHATADWGGFGRAYPASRVGRTMATATTQGSLDKNGCILTDCHLADRFVKTAHCIPPIVPQAWRLVISLPHIHMCFFHQVQKTCPFFGPS